MLILDTSVETDSIEKSLKWFAENQAGFSNRISCDRMVESIIKQAYNAAKLHSIKDLSDWESCNLEHFVNVGDIGGTIDMILVQNSPNKVLIVDWKRVGKLDTDKIWHYTKGPQPLVYTWLINNLYPDHDVEFEFRFMVGKEEETRRFRLTYTPEELEAAISEFTSRREAMEKHNENGTWPRNADSCNDYRTLCPFSAGCWSDKPAKPPKLEQILLTASLVNTIDQCPRKYAEILAEAERQEKDFHEVGTPNIYALYGTMFHVAVSAIYQQIIERNKK